MKLNQHRIVAIIITIKLVQTKQKYFSVADESILRNRLRTTVQGNDNTPFSEHFAVSTSPNDPLFNAQWALQGITPWGTYTDAVWRFMATSAPGKGSRPRMGTAPTPTFLKGRNRSRQVRSMNATTRRVMATNDFVSRCKRTPQNGNESYSGQQYVTKTRRQRRVLVAIIDAGCDLDHPDLQDSIWRNELETDCFDGVDEDGNGYADDCYGWDFVEDRPIRTIDDSRLFAMSQDIPAENALDVTYIMDHGTQAASVVGATTNNSLGITGACLGQCEVMCLRAMTPSLREEPSRAENLQERVESRLLRAMHYAYVMGANISTHNYGRHGAPFRRLQRYIDVVSRKASAKIPGGGHLFVAAAGNHATNLDDNAQAATVSSSTYYPPISHNTSRASDTSLVVGASDQEGQRASFSCYGRLSVDLFAPGVLIAAATAGKSFLAKPQIFKSTGARYTVCS